MNTVTTPIASLPRPERAMLALEILLADPEGARGLRVGILPLSLARAMRAATVGPCGEADADWPAASRLCCAAWAALPERRRRWPARRDWPRAPSAILPAPAHGAPGSIGAGLGWPPGYTAAHPDRESPVRSGRP